MASATPAKRRLTIGKHQVVENLALSPSTTSLQQLHENNDKAEKRKRRISRVHESRRKSLGGGISPFKSSSELAEMYSTIIKMASENKINQKNAWSLHLIDHVDDIIDDRRVDHSSDTFNFQKASCTLDASVKIYSYRVDDTYTSSYKILENLNRTGDPGSFASNRAEAVQTATSKKMCITNTIEQNIHNIDVKNFDLEFDVDPLFLKMSKTFDEGGAKGMLLVNLSIADGCNIAFDSSEISSSFADCNEHQSDHREEAIDTHLLCSKLYGLCDDLNSLEMCPRLDYILKSSELSADCSSISNPDAELLDDQVMGNQEGQHLHFDEELGGFDSDFDDEEGDSQKASFEDEDDVETAHDVRRTSLPSLAQLEFALRESVKANNEYSFFSSKRMQLWAGPEHWKLGARTKITHSASAPGTTSEGNKMSKRKIPFMIDFCADPVAKTSFEEPARSKTSTKLTPAAIARLDQQASQLLFPLDVHYNITDLLTLFTKPKVLLRVAEARSTPGKALPAGGGFHSVGNFIAGMREEDSDDEITFEDGGGGIDPGSDDDFDAVGENITGEYIVDDYEVAGLVQAPRKVEKVDINYATVAKRVDIKQLKDNIWNYVTKSASTKASETSSTTNENISGNSLIPEAKPQDLKFSDAMRTISPEVSSAVTVPFYFICLLHLANEKNLSLVGKDDLSDFIIGVDKKN